MYFCISVLISVCQCCHVTAYAGIVQGSAACMCADVLIGLKPWSEAVSHARGGSRGSGGGRGELGKTRGRGVKAEKRNGKTGKEIVRRGRGGRAEGIREVCTRMDAVGDSKSKGSNGKNCRSSTWGRGKDAVGSKGMTVLEGESGRQDCEKAWGAEGRCGGEIVYMSHPSWIPWGGGSVWGGGGKGRFELSPWLLHPASGLGPSH